MSTRRAVKTEKTVLEEIVEIETRIADLETAYVQDTRHRGNAIRGWGNPGKTKPSNDDERIFSLSSRTSPLNNNRN
jgi:hypothetical protein